MICQSHAHITTRCIVHDQIESALALEGKVEPNYKLVRGKTEYITLSARVSNQVLAEHFVFFKNLHGVVLLRTFTLLVYQVDGAETALAERLDYLEAVEGDLA